MLSVDVDVDIGATRVAATVGIRGVVVGGTVAIEKGDADPLDICALTDRLFSRRG
jgi:hypothetical protein